MPTRGLRARDTVDGIPTGTLKRPREGFMLATMAKPNVLWDGKTARMFV